jgi:ATPase subunit of ABC transporter with duplicated ATPase domains
MIALNKLGMAYGSRLLFYDVNLNLLSGKCYALVGANGAGKSTLFNVINGQEEASDGSLLIPKEASLGWLKQDQFRYEDTPILHVVLQGKKALWEAMEEKETLLLSEEWDDKTVNRLSAVEEKIAHFDGYSAESIARSILSGLGIDDNYHDKPLKSLSGGYKLRVLLAQTLFQNPSILLLDEPTNHLDILSISWLEKFLKQEFKGLVIFISHDKAFINNLADHILDLDYGEIRQYGKGYQRFLEEKTLVEEQKQKERAGLEAKIAHMQKFVDKFRAKASKARQAQSKLKQIEKVEMPDMKHSSRNAPTFEFKGLRPSGKQVIKLEGIAKAFKDKQIVKGFNLTINRGERVAIMGVNGVGKSTLIKMMNDLVQPDEGEITWGHETHVSYFSQDHHDELKTHQQLFPWLREHTSNKTDQEVRKALARMLFVKDDVEKDILSISGGEAARLLLARVMLENPNVLILDEPTNHMDLETIDSLGSALKKYDGTVMVVSHNRDFIGKFANRILFLTGDKGVIDFKGTYRAFLEANLIES